MTAFALVMARVVREIERSDPAMGRVARSAVEHYNAQMTRLNGRAFGSPFGSHAQETPRERPDREGGDTP